MKSLLLAAGLLLCIASSFGQEKLSKDLDGDKIADTVGFQEETSRIFCALSTQKFKRIYSQQLETLGSSGVSATKSGFEFCTHAMRGGCCNQFRYDVKLQKIQLIGMSRYEFGNAANDGSGESSVNLLTSSYIGNWNYYSDAKKRLIKLPAIKTNMTFAKTYLEAFSDKIYFEYMDKCADLYQKQKAAATGKK